MTDGSSAVWVQGLNVLFDEPRAADVSYWLTEGSGLGSLHDPSVATSTPQQHQHRVRVLTSPAPLLSAPLTVASSVSRSEDRSLIQSQGGTRSRATSCGDESVASGASEDDGSVVRPKVASSVEELRRLVYPTFLCNVTEHTHMFCVTATIHVTWDFLVAESLDADSGQQSNTMVLAPLEKIPSGFKESLVSLMEFGEEDLDCDNVAVVLKRDGPDRANLVKLFMYFGFELVAPNCLPKWINGPSITEEYFFMISSLR